MGWVVGPRFERQVDTENTFREAVRTGQSIVKNRQGATRSRSRQCVTQRPIPETTYIASVEYVSQSLSSTVPDFNLQLPGVRRVMGIDRHSAPRTVQVLGRQRPSLLDDGQVAMIPPPRSQTLPGLTARANGRRGLMVVPSINCNRRPVPVCAFWRPNSLACSRRFVAWSRSTSISRFPCRSIAQRRVSFQSSNCRLRSRLSARSLAISWRM